MQLNHFFIISRAVKFGFLVAELELAFFWSWSILARVWAPWKAALGARPATKLRGHGAQFLKIGVRALE